jgi:hypothetical protein
MNIAFDNEQFGKHEWPNLKVQKMLSTEAEDIEKVTEMSFVQWGQALLNGNALCGRALVWTLLRRENRNLRFRNVNFTMDELSVELDDEEKQKLREELKKNDDLSPEDKREILLALGEDIDDLDFEPTPEEAETPGNGSGAESVAGSG